MPREKISKIAYKTIQQGKSIAGLAHKQISARIMNFILPDTKIDNLNIDRNLLTSEGRSFIGKWLILEPKLIKQN